jgi:hypothetical protein
MVRKTSGERLEVFVKLRLLRLLASIVAFTLFSITVGAEYNATWRDLAPPEISVISRGTGDADLGARRRLAGRAVANARTSPFS